MSLKHRAEYAYRTVAALLAAGLLLATSCSLRELEAVSIGLGAAADQLEHDQDEDLTFGEWLLSELDD